MRLSPVLLVFCATVTSLPARADDRVEVRLTGEPGPYGILQWKHDWPGCGWEDGIAEGHASLVSHDSINWLRISYAIGGIGPEKGGAGWRWPIGKNESAELRYTVRFSKDFDWVK